LEDSVGRFSAWFTLAAVLVAAGCSGSITGPAVPSPTSPAAAPIQHVVILLQENRSFDNVFAGFPGADTVMSGPCLPAPWCKPGQQIPLKAITLESTESVGFGTDIDHSHNGFEIEYNHGKMNGFDKIRFGAAGAGLPAKRYPYAFIERSETKPYWDFAKQYAIADHMFFTATASSYIAHQQIIAGTTRLNAHESLTDQPDGMPWGCDAEPGTVTAVIKTNGQVLEFGGPFPCFTQYGTMADLLDAANVSWKYYVADFQGKDSDFSGEVWNGFDDIKKVRYGPDWKTHISEPTTNVLSDVKNGSLPAVSWVIPTLENSDHPASGCNHGPRWITSVVNLIGKSKYWNSTAIVLLWDDWGGWYDNVPPPQINYTSLGFRVPMVVISPFSKPGSVSHTQYDFGSVLKFIEQNFGLGSLGTSDVTATSMADIFDFSQPPMKFVPEPPPHVIPCKGSGSTQAIIEHDGGVPE
jgi:phospholipase C